MQLSTIDLFRTLTKRHNDWVHTILNTFAMSVILPGAKSFRLWMACCNVLCLHSIQAMRLSVVLVEPMVLEVIVLLAFDLPVLASSLYL